MDLGIVELHDANNPYISEPIARSGLEGYAPVRGAEGCCLDTMQWRLQREGHAVGSKGLESWSQVKAECRRQEGILKEFLLKPALVINSSILPETGGKEHDVLIDIENRIVHKRLKNTKERWGRVEWTPFEYLDSIRLFNTISPFTKINVVGSALHQNNLTLITSMPLVVGPHPTPEYTHSKLCSMGFEQYQDGVSRTVDYRSGNVVIYDAHHKNFILDVRSGELVPIDLQVRDIG